jgi:hypothetical protein
LTNDNKPSISSRLQSDTKIWGEQVPRTVIRAVTTTLVGLTRVAAHCLRFSTIFGRGSHWMNVQQWPAAWVSQNLPFKGMASASLAPWPTWQAWALHRGYLMPHAIIYLALLMLLRGAPATSTRFTSLTMEIPKQEFANRRWALILHTNACPPFPMGTWGTAATSDISESLCCPVWACGPARSP